MSQIQLVAGGAAAAPTGSSRALPHILLLLDGFPKVLGGGERIVLRLAALLPHYGFRASILALSLHPDSEFYSIEAPCPVYLLPLTSAFNLAALRGALALRRFLLEQEVCLVQTFFESSDIWAGFVTRIFSQARLVWSRRDMGILRSAKHRLAYRVMRRFPHAVIAVSARVAEHVITEDHVSPSKVHVVYNGLDLEENTTGRPEAVSQRRPIVVTTIGNIRQVKGHDLLVLAASTVNRRFPEVLFTVAGEVLETTYYKQLQQQIATLGLSNKFTFLGKLSDLRKHLETASIFVLPSRSEGFSNALIEAMVAGIPAVATDVGGNAEAIQNGSSGLIVPPEDAGALAAAIEALLDDPALAERLSIGGRHAVEEKFSSGAMMRGIVNVFSTLLR